MHIIQIGREGYLKSSSGDPSCTQSEKDARRFNTKTQAERMVKRLHNKFPDFVSDGTQILPATIAQ